MKKKQYEKRAEFVSITDPLHELGSFFHAGARRTNTLWGTLKDQIRGTKIGLGACRYGSYKGSSSARPWSLTQTLRDR